jgi:hypothetical protein
VFFPNPKSKIENPKCYLFTRSARASTFDGIVRPTCLRGLQSDPKSNFFGGNWYGLTKADPAFNLQT